jgi:hypothetical protein
MSAITFPGAFLLARTCLGGVVGIVPEGARSRKEVKQRFRVVNRTAAFDFFIGDFEPTDQRVHGNRPDSTRSAVTSAGAAGGSEHPI